ncbi:hypothetical protein LDENG_00004440, partial [Lucifuga dentata]
GLFSLKLHAAHCFTLFSFWLFLAFSRFCFCFFFLRLSLASCSRIVYVPFHAAWRLLFSSCLLSSPLLKQRLAVLYFKVISSNFISCSKKFLPESAIDVITTST